MSMYEESVARGATASRGISDHPTFSLCVRLMRDNKTAGYSQLKKLWINEVRDDPELLDDVLTYAFRNYYSSLAGRFEPPAKTSKQEKAAVQQDADRQIAAIEDAIQVQALKNCLLPNGKTAWDATLGELGKFCKFGLEVTKLGKPTDLVSSLPLSKLKKIKLV